MGITIHYRGSIADLARIEDFEDRVLDLALELGGEARVWQSSDKSQPSRRVRGLIVDLSPGQEATSLLFSPEGWLIGLIEIEDAELGRLTEPPYCFVKTQYGSVEGHVALVELLRAIKAEFLPNLEVSDEGGYWENRDLNELRRRFAFLQNMIATFADALEDHPLSSEAAEDPDILVTRIERIAQLVHRTVARPAEHPPVEFPNDELGIAADPIEEEARWDELYRENRRKQERMHRSIEDCMLQDADAKEAFEAAMNEVVPPPVEVGETQEAPWSEAPFEQEPDEPWQESLPEAVRGVDDERRARHPLQAQATRLLLQLGQMDVGKDEPAPNLDSALRSMTDVVGGLAQALPLAPYEMDDIEAGLAIVQLKRALRGAAFALGSLFLIRADEQINKQEFDELYRELNCLQASIVEVLRVVRNLRQ